jgi:hypothetical protein
VLLFSCFAFIIIAGIPILLIYGDISLRVHSRQSSNQTKTGKGVFNLSFPKVFVADSKLGHDNPK